MAVPAFLSASSTNMQTYRSSPFSHFSPALASAGYVQVQRSQRGRLFYIPENLYRALYENPEAQGNDPTLYPPQIFQPRLVRPHRIHIARVHPEIGIFATKPPPELKKKSTKVNKAGLKKRNTVSVIINKTGIKASAKKLLRGATSANKQRPIADTAQNEIEVPVEQGSVPPENITFGPEVEDPVPVYSERPAARTSRSDTLATSTASSSSNSPSSSNAGSAPPSRKPSLRRPESWAPGFSSGVESRSSTGMRPSFLLSRKESKRRSAAISSPTEPIMRSSTTRTELATALQSPQVQPAMIPALVPAEDVNLSSSPRFSASSGNLSLNSGNQPASPRLHAHGVGKSTMAVEEKPLASGTGVTVSITLAEPYLFLQGFEHSDLQSNRSTAMLRGNMRIKVTKPTKIKAISLKFKGTAITKWPEGIPNKKSEYEEVNTLMSHTWPFFNSQFPTAEQSTGADMVELFNTTSGGRKAEETTAVSGPPSKRGSLDIRDLLNRANNASNSNLSERRLSQQPDSPRTRSLNRADAQSGSKTSADGPTVAQKGYKVFQPGEYVYNFELPLDSHLPESISVELGSVKYELEALVERSGAFRGNLVGTKEVTLIRTPAEGSLEQVEPIAIARTWDDQLHYDIVISGKSFPLGSKIPIAFKLTPLAKVHCHRVKVYITEAVEYFCDSRRVHRTEPARRMLLCEKRADGQFTSAYPGSSMRIVSGGGVPYDLRAAAARGDPTPVADPTNILGHLESQNSHDVGPTELEICAQLPTCENVRGEKDKLLRLHPDSTYANIQVHHWIKIVLRLSRPDANEPGKRRHFEISIDSPFHILSCRARDGNLFLPAYLGPPGEGETDAEDGSMAECGCPGARSVARPQRRSSPIRGTSMSGSPHPLSRELGPLTPTGVAGMPALPPSAHVHTGPATGASGRSSTSSATIPSSSSSSANSFVSTSNNPSRPSGRRAAPREAVTVARPMHIIRYPSYNPPAFDAEQPPPPLETPPPLYDTIASPTTGMADYFARYSDAYAIAEPDRMTAGEDEVEEVNSGEETEGEGVRTPTGRISPE